MTQTTSRYFPGSWNRVGLRHTRVAAPLELSVIEVVGSSCTNAQTAGSVGAMRNRISRRGCKPPPTQW